MTSGPHPSPENKRRDGGDHAGSGPWAFPAGPDLELTPFCQVGQGLGGTDRVWVGLTRPSFPSWEDASKGGSEGASQSPTLVSSGAPRLTRKKPMAHLWACTPGLRIPALCLMLHTTLPFARPPGPLCKQGAPPHASGVQLGACHLAGPVSLCCLLEEHVWASEEPAGCLEAGVPCGGHHLAGSATEAWPMGRLGWSTLAPWVPAGVSLHTGDR